MGVMRVTRDTRVTGRIRGRRRKRRRRCNHGGTTTTTKTRKDRATQPMQWTLVG